MEHRTLFVRQKQELIRKIRKTNTALKKSKTSGVKTELLKLTDQMADLWTQIDALERKQIGVVAECLIAAEIVEMLNRIQHTDLEGVLRQLGIDFNIHQAELNRRIISARGNRTQMPQYGPATTMPHTVQSKATEQLISRINDICFMKQLCTKSG